jgi:queuine tRNA-ribosyltransferase
MKNFSGVPILTTAAGSCLTAKNWQEAGVQQVAYYLDALLMKPGLDYLKSLQSWPRYSGWEGPWVLNGSTLLATTEGHYLMRSPFDGTRIQCTQADMMAVILALAPQRVLLPRGLVIDEDFLHRLAKTTRILISATEFIRYQTDDRIEPLLQMGLFQGVYHVCNNLQEVQASLAQPKNENCEHYICGPLSEDDWDTLTTNNTCGDFLESDVPAQAACQGRVYIKSNRIDLKEPACALQFEPIDPSCTCPTCVQQFTRAYLHHLFIHTPLLCQRFLIQHNWFNLTQTHKDCFHE